MAKQIWKPGNMIYPLPAVMVSVTDGEGNDNIITVAWTGTVCTNPAMAYISVRPSRYSYGMLKKTGEFVINLTTEKLAFATDFCGVRSGRDVDKFEKLNLTKEKAQYVSAPMIGEAPVSIECRVREVKELGSHDMFLADVLAVHADEAYMDKNNKFHLNDAGLLVYSHGEYLAGDRKVGTFGYSVKKKNGKNNTAQERLLRFCYSYVKMKGHSMNNITLIGMPGAGKSSIGVVLAKVLGYQFIDSDLLIQKEEKRTLSEIIEQDGIDGFKAVENRVNASIQVENTVIATGGSVVYCDEAMQHLKSEGVVVYLKISLKLLSKRLGNLKDRGVVLKEGQTLESLYEERTVLYEKYADIIVDEEDKDLEGSLQIVLDALKRGEK